MMARSLMAWGCSEVPSILGTLGPYTSPSSSPTVEPIRCSAIAKFTATVVLPTPPLPLATAIRFFTPGMGAACGPCGLGGMCSLLVAVGGGLSSAGVHFEVRVLAKLLDTHKNAPQALRLALFGAAVAALLPHRGDHGLDLFSGRATA